jgi:hypothetical protein
MVAAYAAPSATGAPENRPVGVATVGTYGTLFGLRVDARHVTSNGERLYAGGALKYRLTLRGMCSSVWDFSLVVSWVARHP